MTQPGQRCKGGSRCPNGESLRDPLTGELIERVGCLLDDGNLCDSCVALGLEDLRWLPVDYRDLGELLTPDGGRRPRDPDMPAAPRIKLYAPLPLRSGPLDLQFLIDREVRGWAGALAGAAGLWETGEWSSWAAAHSTWPVRIEQSCQLLEHRVTQLLDMTDVELPARSLTARRADGHDPDRTRVLGREYLTTRDGWEALMLFRYLHAQANRWCGRGTDERVMTPCVKCDRRALVRVTPKPGVRSPGNVVVCRCCGKTTSDDDHVVAVNAALAAAGIPRTDGYDRAPGEPAPVPVGRGGRPGRYAPPLGPLYGPPPPPGPADVECDRTGLPGSMCACPNHESRRSA